MKKTITIVICSLLLGCSPDSSSNERETIAVIGASDIDQYFESVKSHSAELRSFLGRFPKGADLHNHLDGLLADNLNSGGMALGLLTSGLLAWSLSTYTSMAAGRDTRQKVE